MYLIYFLNVDMLALNIDILLLTNIDILLKNIDVLDILALNIDILLYSSALRCATVLSGYKGGLLGEMKA